MSIFLFNLKNIGTAGPHLGLSKAQPGQNAALHGPQFSGDQPQHPVLEKEEEDKKKNLSIGAVWTLQRISKN